MPNEEPIIGEREKTETEIEDPSVPFQFGIKSDQLVLYVNKLKGPFEISAYVEGKGIVTITNKGTMGNELKMVVGKNKQLLPEDIFVTEDIKKLLSISERDVRRRKIVATKKVDPDATGVHKIQAGSGAAVKNSVGM